ncbi:MAG: type II secretion system F family protein [Tenericutes bacterium]|nr:type II secretion system F family protein [Mycoplasmatota bacterium]
MNNQNIILKILLFPFNLLKYEVLGIYYTIYALLYPFIFIFNKIGDKIFNNYEKKQKNKVGIETLEEETINLDSGVEAFKKETKKTKLNNEPAQKEEDKLEYKPTLEDKWQDFYNNLSFVKKQKEAQKIQNQSLYAALQTDTERSEKPVTYKYTAIDSSGKKVTGVFYAYSKMEVYTYLTNEGNTVLTIETNKYIELFYGPSEFNNYRFRNKDLIFWLTQLSTYLKAGITLTDSMRILGKQISKSPRKKRVFDSIIYNLTLGESFSSALEKQRNSFPALLISMVKAAEATGELEETLDDLASYYTELDNTRKAMINAMSYPAIISVFSIAVVVFIMLYVIPQFEGVYASTEATLNGYTLWVINLSKFFDKNFVYLLSGFILIIVVIIIFYKKVKSFRKSLQIFAMKLPIFGKIIIYKEMNVFAKTFASLLKNNVFITDSMNLLSEITKNEVYKEIMFKTINNIAKGEKISESFKNQWAVPEVAYFMIVTGESTGELAAMMDKVAQYYQTEHKTIINNMKNFIEPTMIIFLAVVVGGIVLAVILPMFSLYNQIK